MALSSNDRPRHKCAESQPRRGARRWETAVPRGHHGSGGGRASTVEEAAGSRGERVCGGGRGQGRRQQRQRRERAPKKRTRTAARALPPPLFRSGETGWTARRAGVVPSASPTRAGRWCSGCNAPRVCGDCNGGGGRGEGVEGDGGGSAGGGGSGGVRVFLVRVRRTRPRAARGGGGRCAPCFKSLNISTHARVRAGAVSAPRGSLQCLSGL